MNTRPESELEQIDAALADLGTLHRRAGAQTLTEEDFRGLVRGIRSRLISLRAAAMADEEPPLELTDAGVAAALACNVAQRPEVQRLIRRVPSLMTARNLAAHPGVGRARFHGDFAAIDGGLS